MTARTDLPRPLLRQLRRPLALTWTGMLAERVSRAFWPAWSVLALGIGALMLGLHETAPVEVVWGALILITLVFLVFAVLGARAFRWPRRADALMRMDAVMPGRPLAALTDAQAVGRGDAASEALWRLHQERMAARAAESRAVEPDLKLSRQDPYGVRYIALLALMIAVIFGSVWRVGTVGDIAPGDTALAQGPTWEGWIEPPAYTGLPSLYLADQDGAFKAPEGSRITLRFYGEIGALSLSETVSGRTEDVGAASDPEQSFTLAQSGELRVNGPDDVAWDVTVIPDTAPEIDFAEESATTTSEGNMSQPFAARDDYGVTGGQAIITLDLAAVDRDYGLSAPPEERDAIILDLPLPITGDRADFTETLVENLSQHPWAHLPVTMTLEAEDDVGQTGKSPDKSMSLPARQFFDPLAAAVIEMRRDLLWTRENAPRVAQVLRAMSYRPDDTTFRPRSTYLRLRFILRRLETALTLDALTTETQERLASAMWDLAVLIEDGDVGDALERMRQAQERLSEAMRKGASDEDVARLMQELREATEDYLRQKMQQAQREQGEGADQPQRDGNQMELTQQDLQDMMDRIQELMEQGRMAEAQQALEEFQQLMENLQVTEGQQGEGGSEGQQAMEGLADTLREQQGLSDQAFRDLQEQFNPGANAGQSGQNEGYSGGEGRGESHEGQNGRGSGSGAERGDGSRPQAGEGQGDGTLAERQEALRRELERQRGNLPGGGSEAGQASREALERADRAMEGAENALRNNDLSEAIDQQSQAMEALREGMRNLGEALAENQPPGGQGQAQGRDGGQQSDPLGRAPGQGRHAGTQENLLQGEDVYRRARELLDEIRRRSGEGDRPEVERNYLRRLLDRF
ncbi:TIGR02302 family protein [Roseovarius sp. E0-M6]|uniref:TIGR02302 family protein n=1 Tax=Roseovarius sp. E0-M6 TaxID=3127118 RepID=UPI0030102549